MKKIYVLFLLALLPLVASAVVKRTINVSKAGTLSSYITEDEKYQIEKLTLTGEINGEDIGFLREMARGFRSCEDGEMSRGSSIGSLSVLDMSGVKIVAGGEFFSVFWDGSELYMKYELERNDEIPPMAFWNCKALTSISIPNSVTFIGGSAFSSCPNLASITIPSSVTSIGPSAFYGTPWYNNQPDGVVYAGKVLYSYKGTIPEGEKININKGIYSITGGAFSNCSGLTSVTIPNSVTSIGSSAFQNCGLTSLAIPSSVTSIGSDAFLGTPWYDNQSDGVVYAGKVLYKYKGTIPDGTKISIKKGTLGIAGGAFSGCTGLTSITIPNSVTSIGYAAFSGCTGLTSVTIPNSVTSFDGAFSGCTGLTSVTIPNSVTSFDGAFSGCSGLTSINIPNSVTSIGGSTFANCKVLSSINIPSSVTIIGQCAFSGCSGLTSITIPNSLTFIGYQAFRNCSGMKSVTIPNSVTSVSEEVFYGCSGLTSVTIPNNVRSIRRSAFQRCSGLTSVTIENNVTNIEEHAFWGCKALTSVAIPNSVISIGEGAFSNCSGLTSVTIPSNVTSLGYCAFAYCSGLTSVTIRSSVTGWDTFRNCTNLKTVNLSNSVTSIGTSTFNGCSNLKTVTIPNSVTSIGSSAFSNCACLTSVTIPNSVTSIGSSAFYGTPWYDNQSDGVVYAGKVLYKYKGTIPDGTKISIKKGTLGIAGGAFSGCTGLTSATIPSSVTTIGGGAFTNCSGLTSITIPNSVTSIGYAAFSGCTGLTSVTIPNSVTSIGDNTFSGCSGLTTVMIGNGVNKIYYDAFANCVKLTDVYCFAEKVPYTDTIAFRNSYIKYATLHVPVASVDAYKTEKPWSGFKSIVNITSKVSLSKTEATIEKGKIMTLKATVTPSTLLDKSVTWKSSNKKVATVTEDGEVKGIKAGTATITCTSKVSGTKATCKVTIIDGNVSLDKKEVTLEKGSTVTLKATVLPETLEDKSVTWTSSDKKVATVTTKGKVKGVKAGTATITCTSNATGLSATCKVTVINGTVTLNKTVAYLEKGKTTTLKATLTPTTLEDMSVTWTSSDKSIATVTSKGKVKGVGYGTATITCTSNATGVSATCQVTVGKVVINISEVTLKKTRTMSLKATIYPTTVTDKSVTWTSSDTKVATVTSSGKVKGISAGTATITCTSVATGLKGTCTVTVLSTSESRSVDGNDDNVTGIKDLEENSVATEPYDVYDLNGRKVLNQTTSLDGLPAGIYIVNGKKLLKK